MADAPRPGGRATAHIPGTRTPEHNGAAPGHGGTARHRAVAGPGAAPSGSRTPQGTGAPQRTRTVPGWLWSLPPVAALALVFLYPLALVVQQSFSPENGGGAFDAYASVFRSHSFREALGTTVWLAAGATVGCLVLGFVLALIIAFVPFPGAKAVSKFIDVFLSFPSFLITLALLFIYGTVGMANGLWTDVSGSAEGPFHFLTTPWGVLLAEITYFTPFVMRPLLAAFSQLDTAQLEVASSLGAKPARIVRRVILPEALPALAAGGSLVLVMCLNEFGIVLFTGAKDVTTLPMLVYGKAILESDYSAACVVAVVNIAISVGLFGLYRVVGKRAGA
ncbi:2-aminoethylphosphonate ABC transporter permease subunit [Streptomyces flavotricini]|uniref:2-aminoethylphosphonate ABC transporter permease subunit n=1 Tax=Streptomyces flavotricini TaxID=66888 RepID=A0ABS8EAF1_9ACTN|nr:2-aminoethylphosphonate ABC transporter permease subunit [Streptomyces flavotricini]MCC0098026.1 2-aminoethylphosphonate ABC transporter permease subunit [Streptomyces flavotricini]